MNPQPPVWHDGRPGHPAQVQHTGVSWPAQYAGRFTPVLATTTALVLSRIWHEQGAAGSWGNAALMICLASAMAAGGVVSAAGRHGDAITTAAAFTAAGSFLLVAPAAYTDSVALALIMWLVATALVHGVTGRHWREDRRVREERSHELALLRLRGAQAVDLQARRGGDAVLVAERLQQLEAARLARAALEVRGDHPEMDPVALVRLAAGRPDFPAPGPYDR